MKNVNEISKQLFSIFPNRDKSQMIKLNQFFFSFFAAVVSDQVDGEPPGQDQQERGPGVPQVAVGRSRSRKLTRKPETKLERFYSETKFSFHLLNGVC